MAHILNSRMQEMIDDLTGYNVNMTDWEDGFVQDMDEQGEGWTDTQKEKMEEIWEKYVG